MQRRLRKINQRVIDFLSQGVGLLSIFLGVGLSIFLCGWVSLIGVNAIPDVDTRSNLTADYSPWQPVGHQPLDQEIVLEVAKDQGFLYAQPQKPFAIGWLWPDKAGEQVAFVDETLEPTATLRATQYQYPENPAPSTPNPEISLKTQFLQSCAPSQRSTNTFWFGGSTVNAGYALSTTESTSEDELQASIVSFFSDPLAANQVIPAGVTTFQLCASNNALSPANIFVELKVDQTSLGSKLVTIPPNTQEKIGLSFQFKTSAYTFNQNQRLEARIVADAMGVVYWDGDYSYTGLSIPAGSAAGGGSGGGGLQFNTPTATSYYLTPPPSNTPRPIFTATRVPSITPSPIYTATNTATVTLTPTSTNTPTPTSTFTPTPTPTNTATPTQVPFDLHLVHYRWRDDAEGSNQIAWSTDRNGLDVEVFVMNPDGSDKSNRTNVFEDDNKPDWSPDGSQLVFRSSRDGNFEIYRIDADGGNQTRLTNYINIDETPAWSPDGTKIAFVTDIDGDEEIYLMDPDGGNLVNLTNNTQIDFAPAWSPDGTKIAFYSLRDGNSEIYVMDADGGNQTRLTNNTTDDEDPDWSPDGTKIAFHSRRDGNEEIYVMDADGGNLTRSFARLIIAGDLVWVLASVVLLLGNFVDFTVGGKWLIAIAADLVLGFAVWQFFGLRRLENE